MMHDPTALERETAEYLQRLTWGLPDRIASALFHDYRGAIHEAALEYEAQFGLSSDQAMRRALNEYWGQFIALRAKFVVLYWREMVRGRRNNRFRRKPIQKYPSLTDPCHPMRGNPGFANQAAFLVDLEIRFGPEVAGQEDPWTGHWRPPGWEYEYIGCVHTERGMIALLALWPEEWELDAEALLLQKAVFRRPVPNRRVVALYAFETAASKMQRLTIGSGVDPSEAREYIAGMRHRLENENVGSMYVHFNEYEGTIDILGDAKRELPWAAADPVESQLEAVCRRWLATVGVEHTVRLGPDHSDFHSEMRARIPRRAWKAFGLEPGREWLGK